jgi:hypothetical protein
MIVDLTPAPTRGWILSRISGWTWGTTKTPEGRSLEKPPEEQVKGACFAAGTLPHLVPLHQAKERRPLSKLKRNTTAAMTSRA